MKDFSQARRNMVEGQLRTNRIIDEALLERFATVPREQFVPLPLQGTAYVDEDIPLADGRWLLEPMVLARMLQEARLRPSDRVLDVAGGSGYAAALLEPLCAMIVLAESNAACRDAAAQREGAHVIMPGCRNPLEGCAEYAPYDLILVQGAVTAVSESLKRQLTDGGRLVAIERGSPLHTGSAVLITRTGDTFSRKVLFDASTPYLAEGAPRPAFTF